MKWRPFRVRLSDGLLIRVTTIHCSPSRRMGVAVAGKVHEVFDCDLRRHERSCIDDRHQLEENVLRDTRRAINLLVSEEEMHQLAPESCSR